MSPPGNNALFRKLIQSQAVSVTADGAVRAFLPLLVLAITGREHNVGLIITCYTVPWFALALHLGPALDHFDPMDVLRFSLVGKIVSGVGLLAFVVLDGAPAFWLYLIAVAYGACEVIGESAGQVVLPALVDRSELAQKNTMLIAVQTLGSGSAGPLLGTAVAPWNAPLGVGIMVAGSLVAWVWLRQMPAIRESGSAREFLTANVFRQAVVSFKHLTGDRTLVLLAVMGGLTNIMWYTWTALFIVQVTSDAYLGLPRSAIGLYLVVMSAASFLAAIALKRFISTTPLRVLLTGSMLIWAGWLSSGFGTMQLVLVGCSVVCGGVGGVLWNATSMSYRQLQVPREELGKATVAFRVVTRGVRPLGGVIATPILATGLMHWAFPVMAAICCVLAFILFVVVPKDLRLA